MSPEEKRINILKRAVVELFNRQTENEKQKKETRKKNHIGFNANDAKILTSIAFQVLKKKRLSQKQIAILEDRLPKYNKQLEEAGLPRIQPKPELQGP